VRTRLLAASAAVLLLAGCSGESAGVPAPVPSSTTTPTATPEPAALPTGESTVVAQGLVTPWSMVRLAGGSTLISGRDTAQVGELTDAGTLRVVGEIPGVAPGGEGGLLGLAVTPSAAASSGTAAPAGTGTDAPVWLYAYFTAATDNRILRFPLEGGAGAYSLGGGEEVLTGIAKAGNHNGGRIAFGPDGMLYATTGDASVRDASQDPASVNGKILRMTPQGAAPDDNPTPGSLVYSLGHRNPQGIAWDDEGNLWAAEFGQDTWDELNAITPGANYGWPVVEGVADDARFVNPVVQWNTDEASPSGLAFVRGTFYLAGLGGERLWSISTGDPSGVSTAAWFTGEYGRIRDVTAGPDGSLWMLSSNTDGRGDLRPGDDKLIEVGLEAAPAG
jgi:glucose/arabinose dehydrogenase